MSNFRNVYGPITLKVLRNNGDGSTNIDGQAILTLPSNLNISEPWEVALFRLFMVNSVCNICAAYGNNTFSYISNQGGLNVTRNITIPDGLYDADELNNQLQLQMLSWGDVVYNTPIVSGTASGPPTYFINIASNPSTNSITISLPIIEVSSGGYNPNGLTAGTTMKFVVPPVGATTYSFSGLVGITPGTYTSPPFTALISSNSGIPPDFYPVFNIQLACNLVAPSSYDKYLGNVFTFTTGNTPTASIVDNAPPILEWVPVIQNSYNQIICQLYDQNNQPLRVLDNQMMVQLMLRKAQKI